MSPPAENVTELSAEKVATYLRSVGRADTDLASTVWATSLSSTHISHKKICRKQFFAGHGAGSEVELGTEDDDCSPAESTGAIFG
jgi:hypothetical protein